MLHVGPLRRPRRLRKALGSVCSACCYLPVVKIRWRGGARCNCAMCTRVHACAPRGALLASRRRLPCCAPRGGTSEPACLRDAICRALALCRPARCGGSGATRAQIQSVAAERARAAALPAPAWAIMSGHALRVSPAELKFERVQLGQVRARPDGRWTPRLRSPTAGTSPATRRPDGKQTRAAAAAMNFLGGMLQSAATLAVSNEALAVMCPFAAARRRRPACSPAIVALRWPGEASTDSRSYQSLLCPKRGRRFVADIDAVCRMDARTGSTWHRGWPWRGPR